MKLSTLGIELCGVMGSKVKHTAGTLLVETDRESTLQTIKK